MRQHDVIDFIHTSSMCDAEWRLVKSMQHDEICEYASRKGYDFNLNDVAEVRCAVKAHARGTLRDEDLMAMLAINNTNAIAPSREIFQ